MCNRLLLGRSNAQPAITDVAGLRQSTKGRVPRRSLAFTIDPGHDDGGRRIVLATHRPIGSSKNEARTVSS
jgi:hypothetical protein